jgi:hypothetical protein
MDFRLFRIDANWTWNWKSITGLIFAVIVAFLGFCVQEVMNDRSRAERALNYVEENGYLAFNEGEIIADRYKFIETIGRGAHGIVVKAKDLKENKFVAIKALKSEISPYDEINMVEKLMER